MQPLAILLVAGLFGVLASEPTFFRGRPWGKYGMMGSFRESGSEHLLTAIPAQWFDQQLDHFNPADSRTWKQRYFVNDTLYREGGPVFLQLGGEGTADPIWLIDGQVATNYGTQFGALLIYLEHRFYGESHPTEDMSVANLQFLTSEQSLADAATFITEYTNANPHLNGSKWISFGGSYSGSLSAWLRLKYPHLVAGAIASSAPVEALINFSEYLGVVRDSLGASCDAQILKANQQVSLLLKHRVGWQTLTKIFKLCDPLDATIQNDVANLVQTLGGNFEGIVQYNRDNRNFEGGVGGNITIDTICDIMTDDSRGDALHRYADVNKLILNTYSQKCLDYKYSNFIDSLKAESWNSSAGEGGRQWTYQTCVEFGFFQSSDLQDQPFGHLFPVDFFTQQCTDIFGAQFTADLLEKGVAFTNAYYGGFGLKATRVAFPNGSIDPWHALGIVRVDNPDSDSVAIFINGTAHCADLYPDSDTDPRALRDARRQVSAFLGAVLLDE